MSEEGVSNAGGLCVSGLMKRWQMRLTVTGSLDGNHPYPSLPLLLAHTLRGRHDLHHYVRWTLKPLTPIPPSHHPLGLLLPLWPTRPPATQAFSSILPSAIFYSEGTSSRERSAGVDVVEGRGSIFLPCLFRLPAVMGERKKKKKKKNKRIDLEEEGEEREQREKCDKD